METDDVRYDDKRDNVFYLKGVGSDSWIGHIDDNEDISEANVREYVKSRNLQLFGRLNQLYISSRDIPLTFHGQRQLNRLRQMDYRPSGMRRPVVPNSILSKSEPPVFNRNPTRSGADVHAAHQHVQDRLSSKCEDGRSLMQHNTLSFNEPPPACRFIGCPSRSHSQVQAKCLDLNIGRADQSPECFNRSSDPEEYCDHCFKTIFTSDLQSHYSTDVAAGQLLLRGVPRSVVLGTADRLHPVIRPQKSSNSLLPDGAGGTEHTPEHPSNSPSNQELQSYQLHEIDASLKELIDCENAIANIQKEVRTQQDEGVHSKSQHVTIQQEKYKTQKKTQKVTQYAGKKYKETLPLSFQSQQGDDTRVTSPDRWPNHLQDRCCYCHEPEDGTEMLKCSAELCPIGWFHLRCAKLDRLPNIYEKFLCCYCSPDGNGFTVQRPLDHDLTGTAALNTPVQFEATRASDSSPFIEEEHHAPQDIGTSRERLVKWPAVNDLLSSETPPATCLADLCDKEDCFNHTIRASQSSKSPFSKPSATGYATCASDYHSSQTANTPSPQTFARSPENTPANLDRSTSTAGQTWGAPNKPQQLGLNKTDPISPSKRKYGQMEGAADFEFPNRRTILRMNSWNSVRSW